MTPPVSKPPICDSMALACAMAERIAAVIVAIAGMAAGKPTSTAEATPLAIAAPALAATWMDAHALALRAALALSSSVLVSSCAICWYIEDNEEKDCVSALLVSWIACAFSLYDSAKSPSCEVESVSPASLMNGMSLGAGRSFSSSAKSPTRSATSWKDLASFWFASSPFL